MEKEKQQSLIRPLVISHGANAPVEHRSRFLMEFDLLGTVDPTPWLTVPTALEFMQECSPEGWPGVMSE